MEIVVMGNGKKIITPNEVVLNLDFITKGYSYDEVLESGSHNVKLFVRNILISNNFKETDLKNRNYVIKEEKKYNNTRGEYISDGYSYNQSATLKFDYDKEKMAKLMIEISKLANAPKCVGNFKVKDEEKYHKEVLNLAYQDAKEKALIIATSATKTLKECVKVSFQPFEERYYSESQIDSNCLYERAMSIKTDDITSTFTPMDVEISENLYCIFRAE